MKKKNRTRSDESKLTTEQLIAEFDKKQKDKNKTKKSKATLQAEKTKRENNKELLKNMPLTILELIPIKCAVDNGLGFEYENNMGYFNIFKINSFDYRSATDLELMEHIYSWDRFYRTFDNDIKLIAVNMPVDVIDNIRFYIHKFNNTTNPYYQEQLAEYLMEFREDMRDRETKDFYLYAFAKTYDELCKLNARINASMVSTGFLQDIDLQSKLDVFKKFSNPYNKVMKSST